MCFNTYAKYFLIAASERKTLKLSMSSLLLHCSFGLLIRRDKTFQYLATSKIVILPDLYK